MIKPIGDKVLIRPIEDDQTDKKFITDFEEATQEGEVIEVGSHSYETGGIHIFQVEPGDTVLFSNLLNKTEVNGKDGEKLLIIRERDLICKIEKEN